MTDKAMRSRSKDTASKCLLSAVGELTAISVIYPEVEEACIAAADAVLKVRRLLTKAVRDDQRDER